MKKVVQIVLIVVIVILAYVLVDSINQPVKFQKEAALRNADVIERLKDIRSAQRAYKQVYNEFTPSFDTLINFVLNDSMTYQRRIGSADDSAALASGNFSREDFKKAAIDTVFGAKKLTPAQVRELPIIPHGEGARFIMEAGKLTTESTVVIPVFECRAPYKAYLSDLDEQALINLIDDAKILGRYPGLKVGSMTESTNEAGNWE